MTDIVENWMSDDLDADAIGQALQQKTRMVIPNFLRSDVADQLYDCLDREVPWEAAYRQGETDKSVPLAELGRLSPREQQQLVNGIVAQAQGEYQFFYNRYPIVEAYIAGKNPHLILNRFIEFWNSAYILDFIRKITGDTSIRKGEGQATAYLPGHFLMYHSDQGKDTRTDDRRYAFVLNLTKDWQSHWGGLLQFVEAGRVTETFVPGYNNLSIFKVPQGHQVSYVTPFATRPRYGITGWFRAD
ncbi:2OG-Fe(II) oxygenase [Emcibacter nanhaiensis]|nr:2OG-Fe(II) oxygenase family protein [Emcibacter nanhaiensis]